MEEQTMYNIVSLFNFEINDFRAPEFSPGFSRVRVTRSLVLCGNRTNNDLQNITVNTKKQVMISVIQYDKTSEGRD
jgi:hypothetical protein